MNPKINKKNLIAPLLVLVGGLVSAFVIAPTTGRRSVELNYDYVQRNWADIDTRSQKNVIGWFKPEDSKSFQNAHKYLKEMFEYAKNKYEANKGSFSVMGLAEAEDAMKSYRIAENSFSYRHGSFLNLKETTKAELNSHQLKQKTLASSVETLTKQIAASNFQERHKKILLDSLVIYEKSSEKAKNSIQLLTSLYNSEYEGKSAVDEKQFTQDSKTANDEIGKAEGAYMQTSNLFIGFINAPQTVPTSIQTLKTNIASIEKELSSPTQPKILAVSSKAMHKTDSLLKVCTMMLPTAEAKANTQEYIDALLILEKMNPAEIALLNEYNFQKESYNNFIANYNAIDKDLKAVKGATVNNSDRSSVDRLSNEALLAQQLAWQYAMAGNWVYAKSQLNETSMKSDRAYNLAFKKPSTRYSSSSSYSGSNKYSSGNSYSSSKSSSGSSSSGYKSSSGSSYSSSSKKSDSRSWSSSSSSSSKKSSSSSSSSRRSDSRSWGSSSKKRR